MFLTHFLTQFGSHSAEFCALRHVYKIMLVFNPFNTTGENLQLLDTVTQLDGLTITVVKPFYKHSHILTVQ